MSGREVEAAVLDNGEDISRWTGLADHGNGIMVIVLGLFALYRYLRAFVYPCLTLFELHNATKIVDNAYRTARNPSIPDAPEWYGIANDYLSLNIEASRIREKGLQLSLWNTYVGFHPKLMFDIARCYTKYEELRRRILVRSCLPVLELELFFNMAFFFRPLARGTYKVTLGQNNTDADSHQERRQRISKISPLPAHLEARFALKTVLHALVARPFDIDINQLHLVL
ncbi:hypothetical protein E1B28_010532 [Marasmius oreades]|uniref:Uncharacterized protein n=1 Tax=Marasmius oreades TaxID=181124 RepID=A0A9P7URL1_9AGAR|nr:uncharacterized protein E1B28_010532 [Marasmius oreades]KAG7091503.1 hypothetical protein E1B28_010532 [Marasmius oreades]